MSAQLAAFDNKNRAFEYMIRKGAKKIYPTISIDCIEKATVDGLRVSIAAENFFASSNPVCLERYITRMGFFVAGAALSIVEDSPDVDSLRYESQVGVRPSRSDELVFDGIANRKDGVAVGRFFVHAKRGKKYELVCKGSRSGPAPTAPTARN